MTEGNTMHRTNTDNIDDEATRAQARSIVERNEQDERERRARYARPLNFSRPEASASAD